MLWICGVCICMDVNECMHICIYIYIYTEREREMCIFVCMNMCIYVNGCGCEECTRLRISIVYKQLRKCAYIWIFGMCADIYECLNVRGYIDTRICWICEYLWKLLIWAELIWASELVWADDLIWTDLCWADLSWSELIWADLNSSELSWSELIWADLSWS